MREAMHAAGVDFRLRYECGSMLQVRQLVSLGACAGVLPTLGVRGLEEKEVLTIPFAPMKEFGRALVLHWNPRQLRRRNVDDSTLHALARTLKAGAGAA